MGVLEDAGDLGHDVREQEEQDGGRPPASAPALWAAAVLMAALGVFHAWSVLVEPLQAALGASRTTVSAVYSLATAVFAASMLLEPALERRLSAVAVASGSALLAAAGLALAAVPATWAVLTGYGVLFAVANGLGYGVALHLAATLGGARAGSATGAVVASYAIGATLLAPVLSAAARDAGTAAMFAGLAVTMIVVAVAVGGLLGRAAPALPALASAAPPKGGASSLSRDRTFWLLWAGFLGGSAAGLVVLAHAAEIVVSAGGGSVALTLGASVVAAGNGAGRLLAGWLSDRVAVRRVLWCAEAALAGALLALAAWPAVAVAVVALLLAGTGYGALAGAYPVAGARYYGAERITVVYARVFTAWGLAGLAAPVAAGALFDATGGYGAVLAATAAAAALGAAASLALPAEQPRDAARTV